MGILTLYGLVLLIIYTAPAVLYLWPLSYSLTKVAYLIMFLLSVWIFVRMGRSLGKRRIRPFWPSFVTSAMVAFLGTGFSQYVRHLPMAQEAFIDQLHGVPREAALTMLRLHVLTGTVLSALIYGGLYGLLGGFAAWWGSRRVAKDPSNPTTKEGRQTG